MASNLETDIEKQSLINNNDDSLHKLYEEKCLFSIPKDEVTDIKHAVEIMVRFLLLTIYKNTSFSELIVSGKSIMRTLESFKTPPNIPYAFDDNNLLKVGSFYENTKNHYPDEFDFIYVIAECRESEFVMKKLLSTMADIFHDCLKKAVVKPFLAETCIEFVRYVRKHGPAAKLEFRYESVNAIGNKKSIFVDISPVLKVFTQNNFPSKVFFIDLHPEWKKRVQATGSFLLLKFYSAGHPKHKTNIKISITESEHQYISEQMSEKHKQVYRLLKYLLSNGAEDEKLRKLIRGKQNCTDFKFLRPKVVYDFPSYVIKTLMFHHCLCCNNSSETISDCVLSVLNFILDLFKSEQSKRVKSQSFQQRSTSFSVSVKTMTGEMIEIADQYNSSLKIKENIEEIRDDISKNQLTEQIPLAKKMVPVVQKHHMMMEKICICFSLLLFLLPVILIIGIYLILLLIIVSKVTEHGVQMHLCWNGTDYMNYTSSVFSNTSNLNMFDMSTVDQGKTPSVISTGNMHCIEYNNILSQENQANMTMANVSRIYYCGDTRSCNTEDNNTKDNIYQLKVFRRGIEQQLVCSALDIENRMENDYLLSDIINNENGMENTGRHLACLQTDSACLNIQKRRFGVGLFVNEKAVGCNKDQPCMPTLSKEIMHLGCYMSQHVNESNKATETEICCCDRRHACTDPEKDKVDIGYYLTWGLVGLLPLIEIFIYLSLRRLLCRR